MTLPVSALRAATFAVTALLAVGFSGVGNDAHAGIIVTVGKPNPEPCREKESPFKRKGHHERRTFQNEGTRCVELPNGGVECGLSIRVESTSSLPGDWRCVAVSPGTLWCETPAPPLAPMGAGPSAAAGGDFDPSRYVSDPSTSTPTVDPSDDELLAVGCGAGGLSNLLPLFAALPLLALCRRRGC
jgi:hypothetical protein